jgi:hypothetical protein
LDLDIYNKPLQYYLFIELGKFRIGIIIIESEKE